ncbi:MAG: hypothetical protein ACK49D_01820 [Flavobacteriia bacterium]|jgi:hypothetical protein|nr:hypothetical protein [Cryomorphaceae bacterium]
MELLNFIFRMGVLFAIYGFIWGIFEFILVIASMNKQKTLTEEYVIKGIKYVFLADVTFLFCLDLKEGEISYYQLALAALVLTMYFVGKLQSSQQQAKMFGMMGNGLPMAFKNFNLNAEIGVIALSVFCFIGFIFFKDLSINPISDWFHDSIISIEKTPVIGFIFKVIGFFFLISMLFKMMNGIMYLLSGAPFVQASAGFQANKKKEGDFDDYEEIN